ncbi:P-loop containing nucleoside triphosphate hydrolase protein [Xylaria telfairii]|nr:P-loop containing nucleoside triphosphate hydrolase protein [Xylaria telfairii]
MNNYEDHDLTKRVGIMRETINDPVYIRSALRPESQSPCNQDANISNDAAAIKIVGTESTNRTMAPNQDGGGPSTSSESSADSQREKKIGSRTEVLHLYASTKSDDDVWMFTSVRPAQLKLQEERKKRQETRNTTRDTEKIATYAVVFSHIVNGLQLTSHSIVVHNEWLKGILSTVLEKYPDIQLDAPSLKFSPPFQAFVHRWDRLLDIEKNETVHERRELLKIFREMMSVETEDSFKALGDFRATGYIDYDHLLFAFNPGDIVIGSKTGILSAGILRKASQIKSTFSEYVLLRVYVVDWDGDVQGFRKKQWRIDHFTGFKHVSDFAVFPLKAHKGREGIEAQLIERGKLFASLCGRYTKTFNGDVKRDRSDYIYRSTRRTTDKDKTVHLCERIMVDAKAYHEFYRPGPSLESLNGGHGNATNVLKEAHQRYDLSMAGKPPLHEFQMMLTIPKVKGFALDSKTWHKFKVNDISSFAWNDEAFENLVLDGREKRLLSALVSHHRSGDKTFDDFVQGKGQGLILLLGGPPGVGKTLTAEGIAEMLKRPLYRVKAGDLGVSADKVERSLKTALDLSAYWDAVLLIDEADIFLGKRTDDNLERNELVSIFLVLLEYYTGVLIFTTNRTSGIDPAFESRIDISIKYSPLTKDTRREIWSNFIRRLPSSAADLDDKDLDSLAEWPLNGRQIKSAVKTAHILASHEDLPVRMDHLAIALEIRRRGVELLHNGVGHQQDVSGLISIGLEIFSRPYMWLWVLVASMTGFLVYSASSGEKIWC